MCYYITGVFSGKVNIEDINDIGKYFKLKFENCKNGFVQNQLKSKENYIVKISNYCECNTLLGSLNKDKVNNIQRVEKIEIEKLKKKGWNSSKIDRYITDKNKKVQKQALSLKLKRDNSIENIKDWTNFIHKLYDKTSIETFGLLLHWYNGSIETEKIKISTKENILITDLTEMHLLEMDEDKLYLTQRNQKNNK